MIVAVTEGAIQTGTPPTIGRVWNSDTGAAGWAELAPSPVLIDPTSFYYGRLGSHYGVLFWGQNGPQPGGTFEYSSNFMIARSEDFGRNWVGCVDPAAFPDLPGGTSQFQPSDFLSFDPLVVMAIGTYTDDGFVTSFGLMRSEDGGKTFFKHKPSGIGNHGLDTGISLGNGVGLVSVWQNAAAPLVWKTTDSGLTWSSVTLPSSGATTSIIANFVKMASGRVLAVGDMNVGGIRKPVVWYTDDSTLTSWSVTTTPVPNLEGTVWHQVSSAVAVGSRAVLALRQGPLNALPGFHPFRTTDDGLVWNEEGSYSQDLPVSQNAATPSMTVADDGAVIAVQETLGGIAEGTNGVVFTVWRGVITSPAGSTWTVIYQPNGTAEDFSCRHAWVTNIANNRVVITPGDGGTGPCLTTIRGRIGTCVDTLTDADIIRARWQAGDRMIINRLIFSIDWDYVNQQFTKHVVYTFNDSVRKYGLRPAMRIESHGIRSVPTPCDPYGTQGCGLAMLDERAFNLGARYADPPPMLNLEVFYRKHTWEPGDIICVTSAFVPNIVTGRRGITSEAFEIINIQQQFAPEGKVILTLLDVEAITLPATPDRFIPKDEVDMLLRMREKDYRLTEVPAPLREFRRATVLLLEKGKKPGKNPPPPDAGFDYVHDPRGYFPGAP